MHELGIIVHVMRTVEEGHAQAVKLEGGKEVCPQIKAIVDDLLDVMKERNVEITHSNKNDQKQSRKESNREHKEPCKVA